MSDVLYWDVLEGRSFKKKNFQPAAVYVVGMQWKKILSCGLFIEPKNLWLHNLLVNTHVKSLSNVRPHWWRKHRDWSKTSASASRSKQVKNDLCDLLCWLKCSNQQINVWQKSIHFWMASIVGHLQIKAQYSRCHIKASITTSFCLWCHRCAKVVLIWWGGQCAWTYGHNKLLQSWGSGCCRVRHSDQYFKLFVIFAHLFGIFVHQI